MVWGERTQALLKPHLHPVLPLVRSCNLRKTLRRGEFRVTFDQAFPRVIQACAGPRKGQPGTWITRDMEKAYVDYHVRPAWYADIQTIEVSAAVAEQLLRDVKAYGAVPKAYCARSVSSILGNTPGFEDINETWSPIKLSNQFGDRPGVRTRTVRDGDPDYTGFIIPLDPETGLPIT